MPASSATARRLWLFAATIFTSAFLLFQVQPLISRFILPWFGGSPTVWSTCMLFFQVALFGGYVYAHLLTQHCSFKVQSVLHVTLLLLSAVCLPITPSDAWKPQTPDHPTWQIITLLTACVGLPYFILSSTGPLLQKWFSLQAPGASPYRLYALSNVGSLLALISYPFVVEPSLSSPVQAQVWSGAFVFFALLCAACARGLWNVQPQSEQAAATAAVDESLVPTWSDRVMWFGLAMVASVMLLATTNQVCLDVAPVPFLWILPLTIYLLSFILCFDREHWYRRRWYVAFFVLSLLLSIRMLVGGGRMSIVLQVSAYLGALFFCCMVCHGELAKQKPGTKYLTSFYLLMSAGGAGGGLFVGLLAPYVFDGYWELHIGIVSSFFALMAVFFRDRSSLLYRGKARPAWLVLSVFVAAIAWSLQTNARQAIASAIEVTRNFYGVLRIEDERDPKDALKSFRMMLHGSIVHGTQFLSPEKEQIPTTYYSEESGVGLTLRQHRAGQARKIGAVGLGVGTVASYGLPQDQMLFYEINPEVVRLAERHFTFLPKCQAKTEMLLGDARLTLEHQPPQAFDILILDAFSGDAIPTHLLTLEAMQLYLKHLRDDGVLCIHVSNLHFDLRPVVYGLARHQNLEVQQVHSLENEDHCALSSHWMLLSREPIEPEILDKAEKLGRPSKRELLWTDEWSNLLSVLR